MRTYKHVFEKIVAPENIKLAIFNASKGKRNRKDVKEVLEHLDYHIEQIQRILLGGEYRPQRSEECVINEGTNRKQRTIRKPNFKYDQIIHHAIIQQLSPIFMKGMYEYVSGSVPGRGAHFAKRHIEKWIATDRKNTKYVCKMDIRHFYATIDHDILKNRLSKSIKDQGLMTLLNAIIDSCDDGLPLGYYTSQWFANFLLQDLDHYIKEQLGATYYVRYMDDMVVFGRNKKELHRIRTAINQYLNQNLKLEMKGNWQVFRFDYFDKKTDGRKGRALDYMGFVFYRDRTVMRRSIMLRATRKAKKLAKKDKVTWHDAASMLSYMGWICNTDTYGMYLQHIKPYVNVKQLKQTVGNHQRRLNREKSNMENGGGLQQGKTTKHGLPVQPDNGLLKPEHRANNKDGRRGQ